MQEPDENSALEYLTAMGTQQSSPSSDMEADAFNDEGERWSTPKKDGSTAQLSSNLSDPPLETIDTVPSLEGAVSPLVVTVNADTTHQLSTSLDAIDYSLRIDEPANQALVFIKPEANNKSVCDLVRTRLMENINPLADDDEGKIIAEYEITSEHIQRGRFTDKHFKLLAINAMNVSGLDVKISPEKFKSLFGEELKVVKQEKRIYNAVEALSALSCSPEALEKAWCEAEADSSKGKVKKLDDSLYCGNLMMNNKNVYVINGFYMASRGKFVAEGASIHAFIIQWNESVLSWADFRSRLIGCANPADAYKNSLRRTIHDKYEYYGLDTQPNTVNNGIHASSSPLEALSDICNWCPMEINEDSFGRRLLGRGIPQSVIVDWCDNVKVETPSSQERKSIFDIVRDMDTKKCADKLIEIYDHELFAEAVDKQRFCICPCAIS